MTSSIGPKEIAPGVAVTLEMTEDAEVKVMVMQTAEDQSRALYSATHTRDFFNSAQKVGTIANQIAENLAEGVDPDHAKSEFKQFCADLSTKEEEVNKKMRPPVVDRLMRETEKVEVFGGDPTTITITLTHEGTTRDIEFTSSEWVSDAPNTLKTRYYDRFFDRLELGKGEWEELTESWEDMKVVGDVETETPRDALVSDVVRGLSAEVKPVADRAALSNGRYAAWYDEGNSGCDDDVPADEDVLWVQSAALREELDKAGADRTQISEVSKGLKKAGDTYTTSKKKGDGTGSKPRVYGFTPSALGVEWGDVHDPEEPETEVEP